MHSFSILNISAKTILPMDLEEQQIVSNPAVAYFAAKTIWQNSLNTTSYFAKFTS